MVTAIRELGRPARSAGWYVDAQRQRALVVGGLALLGSLAAAWLVLRLPIGTMVSVLVWLLLLAVAWQPRIGLMATLAMVCFYENNSPDPFMFPGQVFYAGLGNWLGLGGILPSPIEVLLALCLFVWVAKGLARRRFDARAGTLKWPMGLFAAAIGVGVVRGFAGGAQLNFLLWEVRFLLFTVVCYYLATNTIRTRQHVRQLIALLLIVGTLFGLAGLYRKVGLIDTGVLNVPMEFAFSHDSVIFWVSLILLVVAQQVFGAPPWQRLLGPVGLMMCATALMLSERRSGQIGLIMGFIALTLVFFVAKRKAFFLLSVPITLAFLVYLPVFWNNTSALGQPARAIRSLYQPDPRDASSNFYREMEKINIYTTIRANPVLGVGFGRQFMVIIQMVDVSWWPLWAHQPHNNIMWIWLKMGAGGFIVFWTLMGGGLMRAAYLTRRLAAPEARVFALVTLGALVSSLVFNYVDLALTGARATVFLGTLLGTLGVLERIYD